MRAILEVAMLRSMVNGTKKGGSGGWHFLQLLLLCCGCCQWMRSTACTQPCAVHYFGHLRTPPYSYFFFFFGVCFYWKKHCAPRHLFLCWGRQLPYLGKSIDAFAHSTGPPSSSQNSVCMVKRPRKK